MSWTLCTSGQAIRKAGGNANSNIIISGQALADFSDQVEGVVCMKTKKDWISSGAGNDRISGALIDVTSDLIAMKIINYDMSGYTSKLEAQTMLDVLKDNSDTIIKDLREKQFQEIE